LIGALVGISQALAAQTTPATTQASVVYPNIVISVRDQKLMIVDAGRRRAVYPVSTSRFGLGDRRSSMSTPLGFMRVVQKIGDNAPPGAVFHNRRFTGEVIKPNAPGRDPIVSRILWLSGMQAENANAFSRCIYIHGTAEERLIGRPASFGCIRMRSKDVVALYNQIPIGAVVQIVQDRLPNPAKLASIEVPPEKPPVMVASSTHAAPKMPSEVELVEPINKGGKSSSSGKLIAHGGGGVTIVP
jgi:lipoprotein-anchoring transpeptidase ErfK/SrfK